ncbi:uncharacterized protein MONOS_15750 [Monocercomonoides exilis]|uniref:uncharacterized protein n=1 Tax=Monocercomonoides exilis TaxID=2049356 RepID=UPI00355A20EA|nr:hypothetical protein MONOS_15750 [Monocercomonoides exilis]
MLSKDRMTDNTKTFTELFSELEHYDEDKQRKKIGETNEIIDGMNEEEFESVFTEEPFNKMHEMIEEKKMSMENAILLLKHAGYSNVLKNVWDPCFNLSSLGKKFKKMAEEEEKKEKEKNKRLLIDLCECHIFLSCSFTPELLSICVPCLLNVALNKEENEEIQKEVDLALQPLSNIKYRNFKKELFFNEIKEIIKHHQEHHNLTQLAYQSAWQFLIDRFFKDKDLEIVIVNELHLAREAARELEELMKCIDWKKKEEEMSKEEAKEEFALMRRAKTCAIYFQCCTLWNEEFVKFINSIVQVYRAAKDNHRGISDWCIYSLRNAAKNRVAKVEDLLKSGAIDAVLEEIQQSTFKDKILRKYFHFFMNISERLKEIIDDEVEEAKRKEVKKKSFEKMEENGKRRLYH